VDFCKRFQVFHINGWWILRSLGFNVIVPSNNYSRLLQEVDVVVVIDVAFYNDPILLSSKPNAKQPYVRYCISIDALPSHEEKPT
jgi:hypothetical protein